GNDRPRAEANRTQGRKLAAPCIHDRVERVHGAERGSHRHDGAYEVGGEVEECLEALESPLHLISLAPRLEVQGGIRLESSAKRIEVPQGLVLDADVREGVAPEYRHESLNVGQHLALHAVPLVEVPDHAPVNPAHRTGHADQDREYRAAARGETPEIESQQGSRLAQEIHDVLSSARPVRSKP